MTAIRVFVSTIVKDEVVECSINEVGAAGDGICGACCDSDSASLIIIKVCGPKIVLISRFACRSAAEESSEICYFSVSECLKVQHKEQRSNDDIALQLSDSVGYGK